MLLTWYLDVKVCNPVLTYTDSEIFLRLSPSRARLALL